MKLSKTNKHIKLAEIPKVSSMNENILEEVILCITFLPLHFISTLFFI